MTFSNIMYKNMVIDSSIGSSIWLRRSSKVHQRLRRYVREQRARVYIIWKCAVILLRWRD
ncbi:hypothetical protein Syun_007639 [Stephania yunnanensis]|uniref:Uncharacterized protein n=1 Tax=Stephania yunnanensis TaxID=152371 RepID=A0AAP0L0B4_9MAGN